MALSQMYPGLMFVPWFNSYEWKYVKNCIVSIDDGKKEEGLAILKIWKSRTSKLPSAIEGTLMLLTALLKDSQIKSQEQRFRCYCCALLRFLNICCGQYDKQGTFYRTAKKNNFPDWIVDFRHALAHGLALPGILEIHDALLTCLNWIINEYWIKQSETLKDYIIEEPYADTQILDLYCNITLDKLLYKNAVTLMDLDRIDDILQEKIRTFEQNYSLDLNERIEDVNAIILQILQNKLNYFKSETIFNDFVKIVCKYLCSELPDLNDIGDDIPGELENAWKDLLNFFFTEKILLALIWELLKSSNLSKFHDSTENSIKLANLWLKHIFNNLLSFKNQAAPNLDMVEENELITNIANDHLDEIINAIKHLEAYAVSCSNIFTFLYLPSLLKLSSYSETYIESRMNDVNCHINVINCEKRTPSKLSDLCEESSLMYIPMDNVGGRTPLIAEDISNIEMLLIEKTNTSTPKAIKCTTNEPTFPKMVPRCVLLKDSSMFEGCPLGVLPSQPRNCNPLMSSMNY